MCDANKQAQAPVVQLVVCPHCEVNLGTGTGGTRVVWSQKHHGMGYLSTDGSGGLVYYGNTSYSDSDAPEFTCGLCGGAIDLDAIEQEWS